MCFLLTWSWTQRGAFSSYNVNKERKKKDSHSATERDRKGEAGKNQAWSWATTTTQRWEKASLTASVYCQCYVHCRNQKQWQHTGESVCLPPMSTKLKFRCRCLMWMLIVFSAARILSVSFPKKSAFPNYSSTWKVSSNSWGYFKSNTCGFITSWNLSIKLVWWMNCSKLSVQTETINQLSLWKKKRSSSYHNIACEAANHSILFFFVFLFFS